MQGGLVVTIMFSSYEIFVAPMGAGPGGVKPGWLNKADEASLKPKIATSILGVASVYLLCVFHERGTYRE